MCASPQPDRSVSTDHKRIVYLRPASSRRPLRTLYLFPCQPQCHCHVLELDQWLYHISRWLWAFRQSKDLFNGLMVPAECRFAAAHFVGRLDTSRGGKGHRLSSRLHSPLLTSVPMNAIQCLSPSAFPPPSPCVSSPSPLSHISVFFRAGRVSPVRADSSISSETADMSRMSAGIRSPTEKVTRSPGKSAFASGVWAWALLQNGHLKPYT